MLRDASPHTKFEKILSGHLCIMIKKMSISDEKMSIMRLVLNENWSEMINPLFSEIYITNTKYCTKYEENPASHHGGICEDG